MDFDSLDELNRKIKAHQFRADRLQGEARTVRLLGKNKAITIGATHFGSGINLARGGKERQEIDDAFQKVWDQYGAQLLRLVEADFLQQARHELMQAALLNARLQRILDAAEVIAPDIGPRVEVDE